MLAAQPRARTCATTEGLTPAWAAQSLWLPSGPAAWRVVQASCWRLVSAVMPASSAR